MKHFVFFAALIIANQLFAQTHQPCHTYEAMQYQESIYPGYLDAVNETFERAKMSTPTDREEVFVIPVVVHIVYNTPEENLDDSVVFNQIERLNEDYRRMNADAVNTRDTFSTIVGDSHIEFQLATVDPDGQPTTGITRTNTTVTSFFGTGGGTFAEGVKSTADGGIDPWDQEHYLNIWVCDMSVWGVPFILGYATPPDGLPNWPPGSTNGLSDGVVIQYQAFGANNPNALDLGGGPIDVQGRTAVHEVGHYLGLRHIWADGDCTEQDGIDDTPNAEDQSNQDCDFNKNTCTDNIGTLGDLPDMVENYMDYSAETCQNAFTLGQVDLMRGVLEVERYELVHDNPAVGIQKHEEDLFSVYPNPSNGNVTINHLKAGSTINIYDESGRLIYQTITDGSTQFINGLNKGLYVLSVQYGEAVKNEKLVIL